MAQNSLTHRGSLTGYQPAGDEVRADAGSPKAGSSPGGAQLRQPLASPEPLGNPAQAAQKRQERPELPGQEPEAEEDTGRYTATVLAPGPAYGGYRPGVPTGTYRVADAITTDGGPAIESGAGKVIEGIAENLL